MDRKPDFTDEDVGIRAFHIRRENAAEKALEKIRLGLGRDYLKLRNDEVEVLKWILGEIWTMVGFYDWENLKFSVLTFQDVDKLIQLANEVLDKKRLGTQVVHEAYELIKEVSQRAEEA
ncbi:MAG: hypothetical protein N2440_04815 [Actinobacteria bacterium]|nr:hypothetical protein [Actinomycetota bacterium]